MAARENHRKKAWDFWKTFVEAGADSRWVGRLLILVWLKDNRADFDVRGDELAKDGGWRSLFGWPGGSISVPAASVARPPPAPLPSTPQGTVDQRFNALVKVMKGKRDVVVGEWVLLSGFLYELDLQNHHTLRWLKGPSAWRLGEGRGRFITANTEWSYRHGKRGGGQGRGHLHVKMSVLKNVFSKYYSRRPLRKSFSPSAT